MTKEEIIINEKYKVALETEITERYLNVYNVNCNDKYFESQLMIIFSFYHDELNRLLNFLNERINMSYRE